MKNYRKPLTVLTVSAFVAAAIGCATTPRDVPDLDAARSALNSVQQDPLAQTAAAVVLQKGQMALDNGQNALDKNQPLELVEHFAYLAKRDAEIAEAQIGEARAKASIDKATEERNQIVADARAREANQARLQAQNAQAQAQNARAQAQDAQAQAQNAQAQAISAEARAAQLQQEIADMQAMQAKQTDRGYVLSLGDVLFDTGQATLKPGAQVALMRLGTFMNKYQDQRVEIDGNTDSTGSPAFNQQLSEARADAVRDALLAQGVDSSRIIARGLGQSMPVAGNDTAAGRQQNRRVDVVFLDTLNGTAANGRFGGGLRLGQSN
jgi:outer membrane protein OmpA-like peptidoglycan-associated protein